MQLDEVWRLEAVDGRDAGAAPFRLEAEPAVPRADVQHALAAQVFGNGEPREALPQARQRIHAVDQTAVGQFETVIPTLFGQFLAVILPFAGFRSEWGTARSAPSSAATDSCRRSNCRRAVRNCDTNPFRPVPGCDPAVCGPPGSSLLAYFIIFRYYPAPNCARDCNVFQPCDTIQRRRTPVQKTTIPTWSVTRVKP